MLSGWRATTMRKSAIAVLTAALGLGAGRGGAAVTEVRFMTLDPGHFHAGLVQKEMYRGASRTVHVYAPIGADLTEHLNRIAAFNTRKENPTSWELEIHACPDF